MNNLPGHTLPSFLVNYNELPEIGIKKISINAAAMSNVSRGTVHPCISHSRL